MFDMITAEDHYTLSLIDGSPIPPFIIIDEKVIKVHTDDLSNCGRYTIQYMGCTPDKKLALLSYIVDVKYNTPPFISLS